MAYRARALPLLTVEEFLAQRHTFPGKVELVHGIVYPMYDHPDRLMTGGTDKHNKVTVNAVLALSQRHGRPAGDGSDFAIRSGCPCHRQQWLL